jgi:excisionase family DNA binding protein
MRALLTVKQAAERLMCSRATVYQLCTAKLLTHSRVGLRRGVIRIAEEDIARYLSAKHVEEERQTLRFIR